MLSEGLLYLSVSELGAMIRSRKISPVELTESYLERLRSLGPKLGALATLTDDLARKQARQAEKEIMSGKYRGPLHGIPYGAKDLLATRAIPTTWGATPYRDQVFDYDATVVRRLADAGAILAAKLAMVELAGGMGYNRADACWTGTCRTPWNLNYWSGGSSSGPGAATAAALVGFSIGSETSGSIVTPASFCGISGLRPTYGRVSRHGAMALCWTLDKLGPMCRSARDCGLVLKAIAGRDPDDGTATDAAFSFPPLGKPSRRWRVGVIKGSADKVQPEVKRNFEHSVGVFRQFAEVDEAVEFPDFPGQVVGIIVNAEGGAAFRELIESGKLSQLANGQGRVGGYTAMLTPAVDYVQAMRLRAPMRRAFAKLFEKYDALLAPSRTTVSYPVDVEFEKAYPGISGGPPVIPVTNAVGIPAISIPNGLGIASLPTGLQIIGGSFAEETILSLAVEYQARTDFHKKKPAFSEEKPAKQEKQSSVISHQSSLIGSKWEAAEMFTGTADSLIELHL
ncbi:MAG TPA: amidase [Acidobacteriota bacterium]